MLLVHEYSEVLPELEKSIPSVLLKKVYLLRGKTPMIFPNQKTVLGYPVYLIYLGSEVSTTEKLISKLEDSNRIILVSSLARFSLYRAKLAPYRHVKVSDELDTLDQKVALVKRLTKLSAKRSKQALELLNYNLGLVEKNLELLRICNSKNLNLVDALEDVVSYSYNDVLLYLAGSPKADRGRFLKTLSKYRYADKHMLKYLRNSLRDFIKVELEGGKPRKENEYTVRLLRGFLALEDAMRLELVISRCKHLPDLLKGEVLSV